MDYRTLYGRSCSTSSGKCDGQPVTIHNKLADDGQAAALSRIEHHLSGR